MNYVASASRRRTLIAAIAASIGALGLSAPAFAQPWPAKPITLIVPFPAGGATDVISRVLTHGLQTLWGQSVLQEYQPGASGLIGSRRVAQSPADGYTLLLASTGAILALAASGTDPNYRITQELAPISLMSAPPYILVVNPKLPVTTAAELIAYAKANPGKLTYGSSGAGSASVAGQRVRASRHASGLKPTSTVSPRTRTGRLTSFPSEVRRASQSASVEASMTDRSRAR